MSDNPVDVKKPGQGPVPPSADPWRVLRHEMDRLFDRFAGGFGMPSLRRMFDWEPPFRQEGFGVTMPTVDVSENDQAYTVCAELPGLAEKDIDISISGDMLVIKGEKRQDEERKEQNWHMSERSYGSFRRAFALPQGVDRDSITANLSKGVLRITLPKSPQAQQQTKKIEVKPAG